MLPLGRQAWQPDLLMVLLAFWALNQPQRVGMGVAFLLGLCMDVDRSSCWASMRWPMRCWCSRPAP